MQTRDDLGGPLLSLYKFIPHEVSLVAPMKFDNFTVALLILRSDAPKRSEDDQNRLQDAHMAHLAKLHDEKDTYWPRARSLALLTGNSEG